MAISFERALGIHEQAMTVRGRRSEVLASNLVNADTPNFKARDVDFKSALQGELAMQKGGVAMKGTRAGHYGIGVGQGMKEPELMYRIPNQPSIDGNTVEEQEEMARFAKNAMDFQASVHFLNGKFKGLKTAIKGMS